MRVYQDTLQVSTQGEGATDLTGQVHEVVRASGVVTGQCTVFVQHTSAGLVIQENADPAVLRDLVKWLATMAPESRAWEHDAEGPDDMPAHAKAVLTRCSENIPIREARLALGTWQAIYLWEHRRRPHRREVIVNVIGVGPEARGGKG
ncbi:MAG TPA: secondary thiamine-phosphate synthase enzyme YjbQ [Polyangiaceae bacterium]|jgi:secondary thiamine-phosphate synthase enzyme|nr:secondary thiamine-phosphate synthase enzyme YjbQ [Polyangiaceae bacterium]